MAVRGGHRLKASIRKGLSAQGVTRVTVGFYKTATYPDGTPVAAVAAWNEFGTKGGGWGGPIPERPFFRQTVRKSPVGHPATAQGASRPEAHGSRRTHGE